MADLKCATDLPKVDGLEDGQMTVGRHQILKCDGDWNKAFDFSKADIKLEEKSKVAVKIFKVEARDTSSFEIDFTLYQSGKFQFPNFILTDGTNEIDLGAQNFDVISVIKPPTDGKPPEPFGPIAPLNLAWPAIYFISLFVVVLTVVAVTFSTVRRRQRYKRLIDGLKQYDSALDPDLQFYRSMRLLEKENYPIAEIEKAFRLYVLRIFQLPVFDLNNGQAIRFMKKRRPQYQKQRAQLKKLFEEFEELGKQGAVGEAGKSTQQSQTDKAQFAKKTVSLC